MDADREGEGPSGAGILKRHDKPGLDPAPYPRCDGVETGHRQEKEIAVLGHRDRHRRDANFGGPVGETEEERRLGFDGELLLLPATDGADLQRQLDRIEALEEEAALD